MEIENNFYFLSSYVYNHSINNPNLHFFNLVVDGLYNI